MRIIWILSISVACATAFQPLAVYSQDDDALDALLEGLDEGIGVEAVPEEIPADDEMAETPAIDPDTAAEEAPAEVTEESADELLEDLGFGDNEEIPELVEEDPASELMEDAPEPEALGAEGLLEAMDAEPGPDELGAEGLLDAMEAEPDLDAAEVEQPSEMLAAEPEMEDVAEEPEEGAMEEAGAADVITRAKDMDAREVVKRRLSEIEGFKALDEGYKALSEEDWLKALEQFELALIKLPPRPANEEYILRAKWGSAEANFRLAEIALEKTPPGAPLDSAKEFIENAKSHLPDHADALKLEQKIVKIETRGPTPAYRLPHLKNTEPYQKRAQEIARLMAEGKQLYEVSELDKAEDAFEGIIFLDRYNRDALRFLRKIADARYEAATHEFGFTQRNMAAKIRDAWNPPLGERAVKREELAEQAPTTTRTEAEIIEEQMSKVIIQELNFRSANIIDVVNFLVDTSRQQDPTGKGINMLLNLQTGSAPPPEQDFGGGADDFPGAPSDDLFGDDLGFPGEGFPDEGGLGEAEPAGGGEFSGVPAVSLNMRRVPMNVALKFVTDMTGLKYRVEDGVVVIKPKGVVDNPITRFYPVDATLFTDFTATAGGGGGFGGGDGGGGDEFEEFGADINVGGPPNVKEMFKGYGVPFPPGTSINWNPMLSQITVVNTPENIEKFERVLSKLNVIPRQIEIEAKFVEVLQNDLEELGLEWIFTDDWEIATREGHGAISARERLVVGGNPLGTTKANRFFGVGSTDIIPATSAESLPAVGNILSIAGVLTNPELQVVLHAIDQAGSANLLSAPRLTTLNGQNAQIEVVEELIYPTEFEFDERDVNVSSGAAGTGSEAIFVPPAVLPGSFETREVGVILNVTPQVNADNYTINLALIPEIAELVDWLQYGASFPLPDGSSFLINIPQPLFASRNITTSIVVWDGHTVVMGGLIREDLIKFEDKIPILGDIPLLGRLFRSKGEKSTKRNLVIFVTARLVDPAGNPINQLVDEPLETAEAEASSQ